MLVTHCGAHPDRRRVGNATLLHILEVSARSADKKRSGKGSDFVIGVCSLPPLPAGESVTVLPHSV